MEDVLCMSSKLFYRPWQYSLFGTSWPPEGCGNNHVMLSCKSAIDIPECDRHVHTHVHCKNRSLIQNLVLMCSALTVTTLLSCLPWCVVRNQYGITWATPTSRHWVRTNLWVWPEKLDLFHIGASGKRWSAETKVWKLKYGRENEKKSHLLVFSVLLTHECVSRPCSQKVTLSFRCESWILGSRIAASVATTNYACDSRTQTKING